MYCTKQTSNPSAYKKIPLEPFSIYSDDNHFDPLPHTVGEKEVDRLFINQIYQNDPSQLEYLNILLAAGANIDTQLAPDQVEQASRPAEVGDTALHLAVKIGNTALVDWLLCHGANLHISNGSHKTPINLHMEHKNRDFVGLCKALPSTPPPLQGTPQVLSLSPEIQTQQDDQELLNQKWLAYLNANYYAINEWLEAGVNPTTPLSKGYAKKNATLYQAAQDRSIAMDTLELLVQHSVATLEEKSRTGKTPLYAAIETGEVDRVQLLLEYGADPNTGQSLLSRRGTTSPLFLAIDQNRKDMVLLLLAWGADITLTFGADDEDAVQYAERRGKKKLLSLLLREKRAKELPRNHQLYTKGARKRPSDHQLCAKRARKCPRDPQHSFSFSRPPTDILQQAMSYVGLGESAMPTRVTTSREATRNYPHALVAHANNLI